LRIVNGVVAWRTRTFNTHLSGGHAVGTAATRSTSTNINASTNNVSINMIERWG
jgi:hypothetical protein